MKYIQKARNVENINIEVRAPIRAVNDSMSFEEMIRAPVTNETSKYAKTSILSALKTGGVSYTDIGGMTLTMHARINEDIFKDKVTIKGERGNFYYVEIEGEIYSVYKTIVVFSKE